MPDGDGTPQGDGGVQDAAYWKAEAGKAFKARDEVKARMRDLEGRALSEAEVAEYRKLKEDFAAIEEDRLKKAGEFESAKKSIGEKHAAEIKARDEKLTTLERQIADDKIEAAFYGASGLFGGAQAETILPADVAAKYFRDRVRYQPVEIAGTQVPMVVVTDATGAVLVDTAGNPLPFLDAMRQVIGKLPQDKQGQILRGSGKTGSGSSGGSSVAAPNVDLDTLIAKTQAGDKDALAALRRRQASIGGMVEGAAWER